MSDWLDHEVPIQWLADMLVTVHQTPNLVWLLLSKRPEQFRIRLLEANGALAIAGDLDKFEECPKMRAAFWIAEWLKGNPPDNVLIGTTVEDKIRQKRIVDLLNIPAAGRFLSCEPLLGHVNILANEEGLVWPAAEAIARGQGIDWVICGGESGQGARPMHENWARGLRDQCKAAGVPFLFKQWGEWVPLAQFDGNAKILESKYPWSTSTDEKPFDTIGPCMVRVGKHAAGRLLDHKEWTQFPGVAS